PSRRTTDDDNPLVTTFRARVQQRPAEHTAAGVLPPAQRRELTQRLVGEVLDSYARELLGTGRVALTQTDEDRIAAALVDSLVGLGRLQRLLDDQSVENINCNGCD